MICKNCGAEVEKTAKFCSICGKSSEFAAEEATAVPEEKATDEQPWYVLVAETIKQQMQEKKPTRKTSFWVSGLKGASKLIFAAIILVSFILSKEIGDTLGDDYRLPVILAGLLIAFFSVAKTMIYLEIAENISAIKQALQDKNENI